MSFQDVGRQPPRDLKFLAASWNCDVSQAGVLAALIANGILEGVMSNEFEAHGTHAGIPYRILSDTSLEVLLDGRTVRLQSMDQLLDLAAGQRARPPQPASPQPKKYRGWPLVVIALIVLVFVAGSGGLSVNEDLWNSLKADKERCKNQLALAQASGVVQKVDKRAADTTYVDVDEVRWLRITHSEKTAVGIAVYCLNSGSDGRHSVYVFGIRDGQIKGSMSNGHWSTK